MLVSFSCATGPQGMNGEKAVIKWMAWNKGLVLGQKDAFTPDQVKRIRGMLVQRGGRGLRELALFSVAIDTMLQGPDLLNLKVKDVRPADSSIRSVIEVARRRQKPPVRCALSRVSANALGRWITMSGKKRTDYVFSGRDEEPSRPLTARHMTRLLSLWICEAGYNPKKYGVESLRRTKAFHIFNRTGDLEAVRVLLGHSKLESTARYLLRMPKRSDPIAISQAFNI